MNLRPQLFRLGAAAVASASLSLFIKNFISGEKKIRKRIARRHGGAGIVDTWQGDAVTGLLSSQ